LQAAGALMGLTQEHEAKVPVMTAGRKDLVALLRDPSPFIAVGRCKLGIRRLQARNKASFTLGL
jgi:hypothetical protein